MSIEKIAVGGKGVAEGGGWGGGIPPCPSRSEVFLPFGTKSTSKQNNFQIHLREKGLRAKYKKLKENYFVLLAEFWWAETRSGVNQAFFVQKRFELRSAIATIYSYLSASIGDSLAARCAGATPKIKPTLIDTPKAKLTDAGVT